MVGTGRCGTSSFYQAARHVIGHTAGHETAAGCVDCLPYPDNHIEVDAQLVYRIPRLLREYPDARWVHLVRGREACVRSLAVESHEVMVAFAFQWFQVRTHFAVGNAAEAFYDRTNDLISSLLPDAYLMRTEELATGWKGFCSWLGVRCDSSVDEVFGRAYNPGIARGRDSFVPLVEL